MEHNRIRHDGENYNSLIRDDRPGKVIEGYDSLIKVNKDGQNSINILVDGVHCAGCIQKIESRLAREQDISHARLNFSTRRLNIAWKGAAERANQFAQIVQDLGYTIQPYNPAVEKETAEAEDRFLLLCLGVAGFATGNIMLLSVGLWTTSAEVMGIVTRDFLHWVSALIAIPAVLFSGRPFFYSAWKALSSGHTNMDVPISVGVFLACGISVFETLNHGEHAYFDSAVMLLFFLLIGRYLDFRARRNARGAATDLLSTFSGFATVIDGTNTKKILIQDLREEMIVRVASGEKFPVDGVVIEGESDVDTSLVTGETLPRTIKPAGDVFAGTMNLSAPVTIRVAKAAENSLLADIVRLMEKAGQGQAHYVRLADRAAKLYTPVVHLLALLTFFGWLIGMDAEWQKSLMIAATVLIITCPCALGLAVPVVQVLASGRLMKRGILVKSGDALERLAMIDTVILDKTGTLTLGHPVLRTQVDVANLKIAASIAAHSAHPLSKALVAAYSGELFPVMNVKEFAGQGVEGRMEGIVIRLGSRSWCGDMAAPATDMPEIWMTWGDRAPQVFLFEDAPRPDANEVISNLQKQNLNVILLSGDREETVRKVAAEVGISQFYAEQKPPEKYAFMEKLKSEGHHVLMVGDGLNDAPVLAGSNVSMAPGTAIDMAQNAADIIFMGDKLGPVADIYKTAVLTQKLVKENFLLAIVYNIIAIPLAIIGFVTPMVAAVAMSGSSIVVIANSFRLRWSK